MNRAEIQNLFRPSGAILEVGNALGTAIETLAVDRTPYSPTTLDLLVRLSFAPERQLRGVDLVKQMIKSPGYVSRVIDGAVDDGLVERLPDPTDRRAQLIKLTSTGEEALETFIPHLVDVLQQTVYSALTAKEVETLIDLLSRISASAKQILDR